MSEFLYYLLPLALTVIVLAAVVAISLYVLPAYRKSALAEAHGRTIEIVSGLVLDAVKRVAFSEVDLAQFEDEALETGRDPRLVAALHFVDRAIESVLGRKFDEQYLISEIEARIEDLKTLGILPRAGDTGAATVVVGDVEVTADVAPRRRSK